LADFYGRGIYTIERGGTGLLPAGLPALHRPGVKLKGDVIIAPVAGEMRKTPVGEYKARIRGYGRRHHTSFNNGVLFRNGISASQRT